MELIDNSLNSNKRLFVLKSVCRAAGLDENENIPLLAGCKTYLENIEKLISKLTNTIDLNKLSTLLKMLPLEIDDRIFEKVIEESRYSTDIEYLS